MVTDTYKQLLGVSINYGKLPLKLNERLFKHGDRVYLVPQKHLNGVPVNVRKPGVLFLGQPWGLRGVSGMLDGVGFGATRAFAGFSDEHRLPEAARLSWQRIIIDIAQRAMRCCDLPLLSEEERAVVNQPFHREGLGVDPQEAHKVLRTFREIGPEVALVGHWNPDFDCIASVSIAGFLLERMGKKVHYFVTGARNGDTSAAIPGLDDRIDFRPISDLPADLPFILIDAPNSEISHVNGPAGRRPGLVIDTHCGETNGSLACVSDRHAAVSTIMLSLLFDEFSPNERIIAAPELSRLATLGFLGIMTDTAMLRRAGPYDIEAVRAVLPFLDSSMLQRYNHSGFEQDLRQLLGEIRALSNPEAGHCPGTFYGRQGDLVVYGLGAQPARWHNVFAAAADEICFEESERGPLAVLLLYRDEKAAAITGILRANDRHPHFQFFDIAGLLAHVFPGRCSGHRGGNVGGGRLTGLADLDAAQEELAGRFIGFARAFSARVH